MIPCVQVSEWNITEIYILNSLIANIVYCNYFRETYWIIIYLVLVWRDNFSFSNIKIYEQQKIYRTILEKYDIKNNPILILNKLSLVFLINN